ncbi:hypothetical protein Csa_017002 [Cucumis sativus]|uniref:Retrotransposon gag domain-containing protein n=1 Tax=Cucumis sativus TaxID=3659 RepID=A0A0A0KCJ9_CUCSA|nr:hypothetical protein Csa_017002 [Cucumis sativus]
MARELSVAKYEKKFTELAKYAMVLVALETERCMQFVNGLRGETRPPIVSITVRNDYAQLVDAAV